MSPRARRRGLPADRAADRELRAARQQLEHLDQVDLEHAGERLRGRLEERRDRLAAERELPELGDRGLLVGAHALKLRAPALGEVAHDREREGTVEILERAEQRTRRQPGAVGAQRVGSSTTPERRGAGRGGPVLVGRAVDVLADQRHAGGRTGPPRAR